MQTVSKHPEKIQIENKLMSSLQEIVKNAYSNLPEAKKVKPWSFVNHGVDLLQTDDELNCYMAAYGKMHEEKIKIALENLDKKLDSFSNGIQVIDWGCGQGLASLCFLDYLKKNDLLDSLKTIILIEPSQKALNRANEYILENLNLHNVEVKLISKYLDDVKLEDIKSSKNVTINFFSNILDIPSVNLDRLSSLVKENLLGKQYFICVGPLNYGSTRIDEFAELLRTPEAQTLGKDKGKLKNTRGTIKLMVFKIEGKEIEIIKTIYYPPMPKNENYMHILGKLLDKVNPNKLSDIDKIMEYYKTVVELEQLKEPTIEKYYEYKYQKTEQNEFLIDLEDNTTFIRIFEDNRDTGITRFPKDLIISIELTANEHVYSVLSYSYLFDDIKDIDTKNQKININLSDFELNYSVLSNFNQTSEDIDELETLIKGKESLDEIINLMSEKLETRFTFNNEISLALSSKNPALLQIYSELRKINQHNIKDNKLLHDFLTNSNFENEIEEKFNQDNLIQITQLDPSQQKAVVNSFNQKLTVITGPPGSGKTQVISNILANAIMQNKKVLVASKNNQAVDNVKTRFDREDSSGYFLRFGSKKILSENTLPEILKIFEFKHTLEDNTETLKEQLKDHQKTVIEKNRNQEKLNKRDKLQKHLPELESRVSNLKSELTQFENAHLKINELRQSHSIESIDTLNNQSKRQKREFELKYSGLGKLIINWFSKRKRGAELLNLIDSFPLDIRSFLVSSDIPSNISEYKNGDMILNSYKKIVTLFESINTFFQRHKNKSDEISKNQSYLEKVKDFIEQVNQNEKEIRKIIADCNKKIIASSHVILKSKIENILFNSPSAHINNYKAYLPDNIPFRHNEIPIFIESAKDFLDIFRIISVTSLSAKASLPLTNNLFDMVIIDEASQCDIASAIPLILRAKQLVVIGDPLQLKHISSLEKYEDEKIKEHLQITNSVFLNYHRKSLWDYSKDLLSNMEEEPISLNYHYRCHPDIIGYSNEAFYIPRLKTNLIISTKEENYQYTPKGIKWLNVIGEQKANNININENEADECVRLATEISNNNPGFTIGIVTPFRHQAERIYQKLPSNLKEKITTATVHKFQGDEKDIMIYSLVVTNNSPTSKINWIDYGSPEMVNVAITRARNTLYIIGNKEYIRSHSNPTKPLGKLVDYVNNLNSN